MSTPICKICRHKIEISESPFVGEIITCPQCLACYEILWLFPLEIAKIENEPHGHDKPLPIKPDSN